MFCVRLIFQKSCGVRTECMRTGVLHGAFVNNTRARLAAVTVYVNPCPMCMRLWLAAATVYVNSKFSEELPFFFLKLIKISSPHTKRKVGIA